MLDSNQRFLALVIPKSWCFTVLIEAHDILGHKDVNRTHYLVKHQYKWKGMSKDIHKYFNNCALYKREKAKVQVYPLQMTDIPDRPFKNSHGPGLRSQHHCIRKSTHTDYHLSLNRVARSFPIPDKKADTTEHIFINKYLLIHMCPHFILSDNGTEFKNQLMNKVLQQLGIDHNLSSLYHLQSNGKLETFYKYLKPTLKKLCEKDLDNWDKYINQVTPHLTTTKTPFFLVYGRDPNLPLPQLLELMQYFLGDPDSGCLDLRSHCLALAILKKTLDQN